MKTRKAFTLVELLVVIAILAVLASVSIIGYTAFTKKAVENNALNELTQVKTLIIGATTSDQDGCIVDFDGTQTYLFQFDSENNTYKFEASGSTAELIIQNESALKGTFTCDVNNQEVKYTLTNGGKTAVATWSLTSDSIELE